MQLKLIGAVIILITCSAFGFYIAAMRRRETAYLKHMLHALDYMSSELQYHLTPLPQLMRQTAQQCWDKHLRAVFLEFCYQLEDKYYCDFYQCAQTVLGKFKHLIPKRCLSVFYELSRSMGRFDLKGQLNTIMATREYCLNEYNTLSANLSEQLRDYRTLGICAGAALVILFI